MDFFYWGKKPLKEGFQFLISKIHHPQMKYFFIRSKIVFFTGEKKPLKEGFQFLISKIHHHQMKSFFL